MLRHTVPSHPGRTLRRRGPPTRYERDACSSPWRGGHRLAMRSPHLPHGHRALGAVACVQATELPAAGDQGRQRESLPGVDGDLQGNEMLPRLRRPWPAATSQDRSCYGSQEKS